MTHFAGLLDYRRVAKNFALRPTIALLGAIR
jgi:hypothetical protein